MHLADTFIQSDLQCIQAIHLYCQYVCSLGIEPTTFALLTQCSTSEPHEHLVSKISLKYIPIWALQGDYEHEIIQPWLPVSQKYKQEEN